MSKYAIVVTCSANEYMYGLNALLNGLDYYGNTADVHILTLAESAADWAEFDKQVKAAKFNFEVFYPVLNDVLADIDKPPNFEVMWYLTFGRWHYTQHLVGKYDAILHTGTDVMCWYNIMDWFEVAARTDFVVMGHNALGTYNWPAEPYVQSNDVPYADTPCFLDPAKHWEAMNYVCHIGTHFGDVADMPAVFYALRKFDKRVLLLPDNHWVRNYVQSCYIMKDEVKNPTNPLFGKTIYLDNSSRYIIHMVHGKYWSKKRMTQALEVAARESQGGPVFDVWRVNWTHCYEACKFLNTQHKLRLVWKDDL